MGSLPVIWMLFWLIFVFDTPQSHPRIGSRELKYLENSLPAASLEAPKNVTYTRKAKVCSFNAAQFLFLCKGPLGQDFDLLSLLCNYRCRFGFELGILDTSDAFAYLHENYAPL